MTAKRLNIEFDGHQYFLVIDKDNERCLARLDTRMDALAWLEIYKMLSEENEQLKCENKNLKSILNDFIFICNRLQSNQSNKQTVAVARDMLQNMGVDLE